MTGRAALALAGLLGALALAPLGVAQGAQLPGGLAAAHLEPSPAAACDLPACPAEVEDGGPGVGDDTIVAAPQVGRVEVDADPGLGPRARLEREAVEVEHGAGPALAGGGAVRPVMRADEDALRYPQPMVDPAAGTVGMGEGAVLWHEDGVGYRHLRVEFGFGPCSSDCATGFDHAEDVCPGAFAAGDATCLLRGYGAARAALLQATPGVVVGAHADGVAVGLGPAPALAPQPASAGVPAGAAAADGTGGAPIPAAVGSVAGAAPEGLPAPWRPAGEPREASAPLHPLGALAGPRLPDAGAAVLLWLAAAGLGLVLPAWWLYHRIARSRALEQPTRQRIHAAIAAQPGVRTGTLAEQLGLNYNSVLRHVRMMERLGLVEGHGAGQRRWFVPSAASGVHAKQAAVAAASPVASRILRQLQSSGATELRALRRDLGLPRSSATTALRRLRLAGLVEQRWEGQRLMVAPAPSRPAMPIPAPQPVAA